MPTPRSAQEVADEATAVLNGQASTVAAVTRRKLAPGQRVRADRCASYLLNKRVYLDYPTALRNGGPSPPASSKAPADTRAIAG